MAVLTGTATAGTAVQRPGRVAGLHRVRLGPVSLRIDRRTLAVSLVLLGVVVLGLVWSVSSGDATIPFGEVVGQVTGWSRARNTFIVRTLRLPRALTGVLVGAAFGVSGQIFQRLVRNPLASPDILGVSSGAAVAAVFAIVVLGASAGAVAGFGLAGSVLAVVAIYLLAIRNGLSSYRLVLIGIGLTAMLDAVVSYLLARAEMREVQQAVVWLVGSLNGRGWERGRCGCSSWATSARRVSAWRCGARSWCSHSPAPSSPRWPPRRPARSASCRSSPRRSLAA
jgi:iron complex transport system permease protein